MENKTKIKQQMAKAVLTVYPQIQEYCDAQRKKNYLRAIKSYNGTWDTEALMGRIIDKAYEIQKLHNMKIKIERRLQSADTKTRRVLEMAFLENKSASEIGEQLGVSERTAFRLTSVALDWFANGMENIDAYQSLLGALAS